MLHYLNNDEELVIGGEEVPLGGVERPLVLPPVEPGLGATTGDTLQHCCVPNFNLKDARS